MAKITKKQQVINHFLKHPLATPRVVSEKFGMAMPAVYTLRKQAMKEYQEQQAVAKTDEMGTLFVKGALSGIVDAQVRDLWPTKSATHPAQGVPADVVLDAERYRWL